jgi:hypothetical protein
MRASSLAEPWKGEKEMRRMITARSMATLAIMLFVSSAMARGGEGGSKIRWDIQHYPGRVLQPGGEAFADAVDHSRIRFTGSGTFQADGNDVTGGGTWETFSASGTLTGSGNYRVVNLVSWHVAPGTLPCPPITDAIAPCADARAGLAVLQIRYSDGSLGKLVVSCHLPVGSPVSVYEGITVSRGFVDYAIAENPDLTMNGTIFHVVREDED